MKYLHFYPDDEKLMVIKPRIYYSGLLEGGASWGKEKHRHNFCEILYITSGMGIIKVNDKEYHVKQGDVVVYNTGIWHEEHTDGKKMSMLFFAVENIKIPGMEEGCIVPPNAEPVLDSGSYDDVFKSFLTIMVREIQEKSEYYKAISTNIASLIVFYILRIYGIKTENHEMAALCEEAKKYIEENYREDLTLDAIADHFHLSKYYFLHTFKENTGISPMKYLLYIRMRIARDLLSQTNMSISQIAETVGYVSNLGFSRGFRKSENVSPTEYRLMSRM